MAEPAIKFDTAAAVDQLVEAGVPQKQAAAQVRLLATTINENFATKADIERLEFKLDTGIAELRAEVHTDIADVRTNIADVRTEVANLETRLTGKIGELDVRLQNTLKWTAGMQIGTILAIVAAVKLI